MPGLMDSMRQKADQAALEADKLVRIRREQAAIDQLRRDIKAQLDALAQAALTAYHAGEIAHPQLVSICRQIDALNEQIAQREARIEQIRAEKLTTPPAPPPRPRTGVPCPNCRQLIPEAAAFCPFCGHQIPKAPPATAPCAACGSPMPAAAQFCPACGARRAPTPAPQTIRCPGCGAELPAVAVFCPDCGTRVGAGAAPAAVAAPVTPAPTVVAPVAPAEPIVSEEVDVTPEPEPVLPSAETAEVVASGRSEVAPAPLTKRCSACQAELPLEAIFCPECGARQQAPG